jgi:hypothetical protein
MAATHHSSEKHLKSVTKTTVQVFDCNHANRAQRGGMMMRIGLGKREGREEKKTRKNSKPVKTAKA